MEIVLALCEDGVAVTCNGQPSHAFSLHQLEQPGESGETRPWTDPVGYGEALFAALFPAGSAARRAYEAGLDRLVLVAAEPHLQAIAWEYLCGPRGWLGCELPLLRGISPDRRQPAPSALGALQVAVVPSNPAIPGNTPLPVESEWEQLKQAVGDIPAGAAFTRARPATLAQLRKLAAGKQNQVIHFLGHGNKDADGTAYLCFEKEDGSLAQAYPPDVSQRIKGSTFLVTLNACVSAAPGPTEYSNLALALAEQGISYVLGMQFVVALESAQILSRVLYADLASGSSVEEAVLQARLALKDSDLPWAVGVPVLYTSLREPAGGFQQVEGQPVFAEQIPQPPLELIDLPRPETPFYGRAEEIAQLGQWLTGPNPTRLITIHAGGGQGKTALARTAVERFAWAWLGGAWASSLETVPGFDLWLARLAAFCGIQPDGQDSQKIERAVLSHLKTHPALLVLDNAETFVEALEPGLSEVEEGETPAEVSEAAAKEDSARAPRSAEQREKDRPNAEEISRFLHTVLSETRCALLVTSREYLDWEDEQPLELGGLAEGEGAELFLRLVSRRAKPVQSAEALQLSKAVDGHPLSLRLLAGAFLDFPGPLEDFLNDLDRQLGLARSRGKRSQDRHYNLTNCLRTSWRALSPELRGAWLNLSIFNGLFLSETGVALLTGLEAEEAVQQAAQALMLELQQRGILEVVAGPILREGGLAFYRMPVAARLFARRTDLREQSESTGALAEAERQTRFAAAYASITRWLHQNAQGDSRAAVLFRLLQEELERGLAWSPETEAGWFAMRLGWLYHRYGFPVRGRVLLEEALAQAQGADQTLEVQCLNNLGLLLRSTGQPLEALRCYQQTLPIRRNLRDRSGEATTLHNIGAVYRAIGQPQEALRYYQQALLIRREVGDRAGESVTLNNIGAAYQAIGQMREALHYYQQSLPIAREVGDRYGEAGSLHNIGAIYRVIGQPQEALRYYQQALPIRREVGDRAGEAATLLNLGAVYDRLDQPQEALPYYQQALSIAREVGDRYGEAAILNNIGLVYRSTGHLLEALRYFQQALPILRDVGDRTVEAITLYNMALIYLDQDQPEPAVDLLQQVIVIDQATGAVHAQAGDIYTLADVLHNRLGRSAEAVPLLQQSIALFHEHHLQQDDSERTLAEYEQLLAEVQGGTAAQQPAAQQPAVQNPGGIPGQLLDTIRGNTIAVLTRMPEKKAEWRAVIADVLQQTKATQAEANQDFFQAVLDLLDGQAPRLPEGSPYQAVLEAILAGIERGGAEQADAGEPSDELMPAIQALVNAGTLDDLRQTLESAPILLTDPRVEEIFEQNIAQQKQEHPDFAQKLSVCLSVLQDARANGIPAAIQRLEAALHSPEAAPGLPEDFVTRAVRGLKGSVQDKMELLNWLAELAKSASPSAHSLIDLVQRALFSADPAQETAELEERERAVWAEIVGKMGDT